MGSSSVVHSEENTKVYLELGAQSSLLFTTDVRDIYAALNVLFYEYTMGNLLFPTYSKDIVERSFLLNVMMCLRHSCH